MKFYAYGRPLCTRPAVCMYRHTDDWLARRGNKSVQWQSSVIPYDGKPYIVVGRQVLEYTYGPNRHRGQRSTMDEDHGVRYQKIQTTKKLNCSARICVYEVVKFHQFSVIL